MNSEQARFVLRAFRPGADRMDAPEFREAFERLRQDPVLASWFDREMASDTIIRAKLTSVLAPPSGLRDRILATPKIVQPRIWWRQPAWLAVAASVALLVTFSIVRLGRQSPQELAFAAFRAEVLSGSEKMPHVSFMDSDLRRIRDQLRSEGAPDDLVIPAGLTGAAVNGCRIVEWHGRKVSMICFHLSDGGHFDLFVVSDVEWAGPTPGEKPLLAQVGQMNTASWSKGGRTYILAANATDEELRRLLAV